IEETSKHGTQSSSPAPPITTDRKNTSAKTHFSSLSTSHQPLKLQRFWKNAIPFFVFTPEMLTFMMIKQNPASMPFIVKILVRNHRRQLPLIAAQAKPLRNLTAEAREKGI
ncbi:MAG: hypothetical protein ACLFT4_01520, partial [Bacteroidales bacterium]